MRILDRLGLAQRIILVISLALVLAFVGAYIVTLGTPGGSFGWFGYSPLSRGINVIGRGPDLTASEQLLAWIGLIGVWATASMFILKRSQSGEQDREVPTFTE